MVGRSREREKDESLSFILSFVVVLLRKDKRIKVFSSHATGRVLVWDSIMDLGLSLASYFGSHDGQLFCRVFERVAAESSDLGGKAIATSPAVPD